MTSIFRTAVAQILCLALVMADFAPTGRAEVRAGSWALRSSPQHNFGLPALRPVHESRPSSDSFRPNLGSRSRQNPRPAATNLPGQSSTVMPDGRTLLLGGDGKQGPVSTAVLLDPTSSNTTELATGLLHARAWHSATLLPSGKVFIFGGAGDDGELVKAAEVFDPTTKQFTALPPLGLTPRAHHTATLLTDGTVFVAGGSDDHDVILGTVQLWDPPTNRASNLDSQLITPRSAHTASIQSDGTILLWGGKNRAGLAIDYGEVFDPTVQTFRIQNAKPIGVQAPLAVAATIPADGTENVPPTSLISVRFSSPILAQSANSTTATLLLESQQISATVIPAEAGMLLFLTPNESLVANATYTVNLNRISDTAGSTLTGFSFEFKTAGKSEDQSNSSGLLGLPTTSSGFGSPENSPYLKLPRLEAPAGETAISGQVLLQSGLPLEGVTLRAGQTSARSDATGRFLLVGVSPGHDVLVIDGRTASTNTAQYGVFEVGVDVKNRETNILEYTTWMPVIDAAHAVNVAFPTAAEAVITTPLIPGLEFHLPAGATVRDIDGNVAQQISITPIPVSQPPFPLPKRVNIPLYFTIQPGGAIISVSNSDGPKGGWIVHPNTDHKEAGTRFNFWNYDPDKKGWHVKGGGSLKADSSAVVPDSGVVMDALTGAAVTCAPIPPVGPCCGPKDGDPVDLGTGLFIYRKTDLYEPDVIPIDLTRVYRTGDSVPRDFGIGALHPYDIFVGSTDSTNCSYMDLFLPDFTRIHFTRYSGGTDCGFNGPVPIFTCNTCPGEWFGSTLWLDGPSFAQLWQIYRRDGQLYRFRSGSNGTIQALGVVSITDSNGNTLSIIRDPNTAYITQIVSPNGRFVNFSYDANNNISQVTDGFGRKVQYSYTNNQLTQVIDANGGTWNYTYDANHNMTSITNPRQITYLTNRFDPSGRVSQQIHADSGTYQFSYAIDPLNNIIETDMTDPRGNVRKVTFNQPPIYYDGYRTGGTPATDTFAAGTSSAQAASYAYDPGTYLLTGSTDALGRTTSYTYDPAGNVTSITSLVGTPNQVTTNYSYQVDFSQSDDGTYSKTFTRLTSVTDPLGHTTQFTYDSNGNRLSKTDPLGNTTTYTNDSEGRLVGITDAMGQTTHFAYDGPDLAQVTDPLGRTTTTSNGLLGTSGGRLLTSTDALGHVTQYQYSPLDQLTAVIDPTGGKTAFSFDGDGNLFTVTDPNQNTTHYTYDNMDRLWTRTDPLGNQECYGTVSGGICQATAYDFSGNLLQFTDRRGKLTVFNYDSLSRLTFTGYGAQPGPSYESTVSYTYDSGDRLTNIADSQSGTITRGYDGLDRLTSETTAQGSISYTYDADGRRQTVTVAGQPTVNYTFDAANGLTQLTQGSSIITFTYDAAKRRTALTLPNGTVTAYGYDSASQLGSITFSFGATVLGNLSYLYDLVGQRASTSGGFARTGIPSPVNSTLYNAANQLTSWGTANLFYDANGNMVSDGTHSYTWDARNQLKQIDAGNTASFSYDAVGRRTTKTILGTSTSFLFDRGNPVQELAGSTPTANLLTGSVDEYFQRTDSAGARSLLTDEVGNTLALADSNGMLQTTYTFEPFGKTTTTGATTGNTFAFTGRELDLAGMPLYFYRNRYYAPGLGRFLSEDPMRIDAGINFYAYLGNSPVQEADPDGTCPPNKSCGIKKAPEYGPVTHIPGGFHFAWGAEFMRDATHDPKCCEVRQLISFNPGPAPHHGFYPPFNQPNKWYEDRDEFDNRYGRKTGIYSDPEEFDDYHGNGYTGYDEPTNWQHGQTGRFRLIVVDTCNGGKTIYTSKTISVTF